MQMSVAVLACFCALSSAALAEETSFDDVEILAVQPRSADVKPVLSVLPARATAATPVKVHAVKAAETDGEKPVDAPYSQQSAAATGNAGL